MNPAAGIACMASLSRASPRLWEPTPGFSRVGRPEKRVSPESPGLQSLQALVYGPRCYQKTASICKNRLSTLAAFSFRGRLVASTASNLGDSTVRPGRSDFYVYGIQPLTLCHLKFPLLTSLNLLFMGLLSSR